MSSSTDRLAPSPLPAWISTAVLEPTQKRLSDNGSPLCLTSGSRNDTLYRVASALRRYGAGAPALRECLDAINRHHASPPLDATELSKIARSAARHAPEPVAEAATIGILMSDVIAEPVDWLWQGRLARGKLSILEGRPDEGKTTVSLDLAARISTGAPMPGEIIGRAPGGVVIVTAEDGLGDTIRPRLEAASADLTRIRAARPDESPSLDDNGLRWLEEACNLVPDPAFVLLDPLVALLPGAIDSHRDQDVRRILRRVRAFAEDTKVAILALRHLRKSAATSSKDAGGGSVGIGAAARVVMLAAPHPKDADVKILARVKGNLAPPWASLEYRVVARGDAAGIEWTGTSTYAADDLLAASASAMADRQRENTQAARDAIRVTKEAASLAAQDRGIRELELDTRDRRSTGDPPRRLTKAVQFLHVFGIPRDTARDILEREDGRRWQLLPLEGERGNPIGVFPISDTKAPEERGGTATNETARTSDAATSPDSPAQAPEESGTRNPVRSNAFVDEGISPAVLRVAEELQWPCVPLKPGLTILGSEADWHQFVATAGPNHLHEARIYLERLRGPGLVGDHRPQ